MKLGKYGIPIAIVVAGGLIATSLLLGGGGNDRAVVGGHNANNNSEGQVSGDFRLPDENDHVRGNPDAAITIVEFSDFECPFCARLHPTLERVVEDHEDVNWVYRHFPLSNIHSNAESAAVASECVARFGGSDSFWTFADSAFANQRQLGDAWYKEQARNFGIDSESFEQCRDDREVISDINDDFNEARNAGGRGTPHVVVVSPNGNLFPFSGALSYEQIVSVINQARAN